jgi:phage-related protein
MGEVANDNHQTALAAWEAYRGQRCEIYGPDRVDEMDGRACPPGECDCTRRGLRSGWGNAGWLT